MTRHDMTCYMIGYGSYDKIYDMRFGAAVVEWCSFCRLKQFCASACKTSTT